MDRKEGRPSLEMIRGGKPDLASAILKKADSYLLKAGKTDNVKWLISTFQTCERLLEEGDLSPEDELNIKEIFIKAENRLAELEISVEEVAKKTEDDYMSRKKEEYNL